MMGWRRKREPARPRRIDWSQSRVCSWMQKGIGTANWSENKGGADLSELYPVGRCEEEGAADDADDEEPGQDAGPPGELEEALPLPSHRAPLPLALVPG